MCALIQLALVCVSGAPASWPGFHAWSTSISKSDPGLQKWNHFFEVYEKHLTRFRGKALVVLECGIFAGGSLRMWRSFFGEEATLFGADLIAGTKHYEQNPEFGRPDRIFIGDLLNETHLRSVLNSTRNGTFDVFLDDCAHAPRHQIRLMQAVLPHMAPGGIYMVEDVESDRIFWQGDGRTNLQAYVYSLLIDPLQKGNINQLHRTKVGGIANLQNRKIGEWQSKVSSVTYSSYMVTIEMRPEPLREMRAFERGSIAHAEKWLRQGKHR